MADFNLEAKLQEQEASQGKVASDAVTKAKENIAQKKLEQEAREVERRLSQAEDTETEALKSLRFARKKEEAQKVYLTTISKAKAEAMTFPRSASARHCESRLVNMISFLIQNSNSAIARKNSRQPTRAAAQRFANPHNRLGPQTEPR